MTDKSSSPICKLKASLGHLCVVLTVQGYIPSSDYYPDSSIILSESLISTFPYPFPSHSCDLLEDLFPSSSQYGFSSALPEDEDLEFDYGTLGFATIIAELLCFSCQFYSLSDILLSSFCVRLQHIYSHGRDCTGSFGFR